MQTIAGFFFFLRNSQRYERLRHRAHSSDNRERFFGAAATTDDGDKSILAAMYARI